MPNFHGSFSSIALCLRRLQLYYLLAGRSHFLHLIAVKNRKPPNLYVGMRVLHV